MSSPIDKPAQALESLMLNQMLQSSGAFSGNDAAGSKLVNQMFSEAMADAIAKAGGIGIAKMVEKSMPGVATDAAARAAPVAPSLPGEVPVVTSGFGTRVDPITHQASMHPGVDLRAAMGTPIPAAEDGVVVQAGPRGGYGNAVELAHPDGTHTLYAHASEVLVSPGEQVRAGETIAKVGETGRATGPHLHLEVRRAGVPVNPQGVLKAYRLRVEADSGGEP